MNAGATPPVRDAVLDHVAVAGPAIADLLPLYRDALGGRFLYGGIDDDPGFRTATFSYGEGPKIELLDPTPGSPFLDSFLRRTGGLGGLHHITFRVPDMVAAHAELDAHGVPYFGLRTGDEIWNELFIHPRDGKGVLLQLAQVGPDWERVLEASTQRILEAVPELRDQGASVARD
jgi:methylmalonyl-CoA/ethylmalonyl-CoA epimerase